VLKGNVFKRLVEYGSCAFWLQNFLLYRPSGPFFCKYGMEILSTMAFTCVQRKTRCFHYSDRIFCSAEPRFHSVGLLISEPE
jgi:hypothetical protein